MGYIPGMSEQKICPGCEKTFDCDAQRGNCWCMKLARQPFPVSLPVPTDPNAPCYCPQCLAGTGDNLPDRTSWASR